MKILAVDTSSSFGAIGLCDGEKLLGEMAIISKEGYAARLLPSIHWLLESIKLPVEELDGFGVTLGPGSFTGLRVGLSTVKGLAYALGKPVAGLNALEVLARQYVRTDCSIVPIFDARRSEIYAASFRWNAGKLSMEIPPTLSPPADFIKLVRDNFVVLGEGGRRYENIIQEMSLGRAQMAPLEFDVPHGSTIATMAYQLLSAGKTIPVDQAEPIYIRASVAEENMRKDVA